MRNSSAERNLFDNNTRGVQVFGESRAIRIRDNIAINEGQNSAFLLVGDGFFCLADDGSNSSFPAGRPTNTHLERNVVRDRFEAFAAIGIYSAEQTNVRDNVIERVNRGMDIGGSPKTLVLQNTVLDTTSPGIQVFEFVDANGDPTSDSVGTKIQNNVVTNAGWWSVALFDFVHGVKASNNASTNPGFGDDYFLLDTSFDNLIVLQPGQTANDQGTNNKIVGG